MPAIAHITRHSLHSADWPKLKSGEGVSALPPHDGDAITLNFDSGVQNTSPAASDGLYEITIAGAAARVKIGNGAVASAQNGQYWADGRTDLRLVRQGERISVLKA